MQDTTLYANQTEFDIRFLTGSWKHNMVVGIDLSREEMDRYANLISTTGVTTTSIRNPDPFRDPRSKVGRGLTFGATIDNVGAYAGDTVHLSEQWIVNGGVRYDYFKREQVGGPGTATTAAATATNIFNNTAEVQEDLFSWHAGIVFKPIPIASIYAAYATSETPIGNELDSTGGRRYRARGNRTDSAGPPAAGPSVIISDAAGNPMRAEISYRGFDSSPVSGRAQGLAVYQNGIRINEAFGDTVNWDVLPSNAISSVSVVSNNPSFGLNALGGAISIAMKNGFSYQGGEVDIMGGSFGRAQIGVQAGGTFDNASVYVAAEGIQDDGFRDFLESEVKRFFGDVGLRGSMVEVHLNLTAAKNEFGATAAAPVDLLRRDYSNTFTSPQATNLEVYMPTLSATAKATETLTIAGVGYYRHYKNNVVDGNVTELEECALNPGVLCLDDEEAQDINGIDIAYNPALEPLGSIERLGTLSKSWGLALEGQEKAPLFGRPNLFIAGASYDHGTSNYTTSSELGTIGPKYVVAGSGIILGGPDEIAPRDLDSENTYWGIYFSNALDITDQLTVTVGGRCNHATIELEDNTGLFPGLNATNSYERFNPMAGANYKITRGFAVYGGYSESNRAPTPAELGCADPEFPCLIESFLTDDPPLDQVVGRTGEVGLRGQGAFSGGNFTWGAGLFRTLASDDILPITNDAGRIFFINAGNALRQGVELSATYETQKWNVYASYALVDATLDTCEDPSGECAFL